MRALIPVRRFRLIVILLVCMAATVASTPTAALAAPAVGAATNHASIHLRANAVSSRQLTPLTNNGNCPYANGYANCDGYDVSGSNCGFIDGSHGAYWVGSYSGEPTWIQIWWAPRCNSNFIYTYAPSGTTYNTLCGGHPCKYVQSVTFYRADARFSAAFCNASPANDTNYCTSSADLGCDIPGQCPTDTALFYCAYLWFECRANQATFNNEYIGTNTRWTSFVTDMLYAPNQPVKACVLLVTQDGNTQSAKICSKWH